MHSILKAWTFIRSAYEFLFRGIFKIQFGIVLLRRSNEHQNQYKYGKNIFYQDFFIRIFLSGLWMLCEECMNTKDRLK